MKLPTKYTPSEEALERAESFRRFRVARDERRERTRALIRNELGYPTLAHFISG